MKGLDLPNRALSARRMDAFDEFYAELHAASSKGQVSTLASLLGMGFSPNVPSPLRGDGITPLMAAVRSGSLESVQLLLSAGARVEAPDADGHTALFHAAMVGEAEFVRRLLSHRANPWTSNHFMWTPLHWIARYRQLVEGRSLTESLPVQPARKVNGRIRPLCFEEVCTVLLEAGAPINVGDMAGITPLFSAAHNDDGDLVELFVRAGATLDQPCTRQGLRAVHAAAKRGAMRALLALLAAGANANVEDSLGERPVHAAVAALQIRAVWLLLTFGADPRWPVQPGAGSPHAGLTAGDLATRLGQHKTRELLDNWSSEDVQRL